ncbi:MAG: hypothetical protein RLZZ26_232 [Candidatus Parcubacteria bacterium]|jgi:glutamate racemase
MIGVFDSGLGGLSVLRSLVDALPQYDYVYVGDTARAPYGDRPQGEVYTFTKQAVDFLFSQGCDVVLLACNTVSAEALRKIQQEHLPARHLAHQRVLGVIVPTAEAVVESGAVRVGVIATRGTVKSEAFPREIKKLKKDARVFQQSCPLLVPLVEAGEYDSARVEALLAEYLAPLLAEGIDSLVLGCTHYEHLLPVIRRLVPSSVDLFSQGDIVGRKFKAYLGAHPELEKRLQKSGRRSFYCTGPADVFEAIGGMFFGKPFTATESTLV